MNKLKLSAAISVLAMWGAGNAMAESEPASMDLGNGVQFTPTVNLDFVHDDNVALSDEDPIESWATILTPSFLLSAENDKSAYALGYTLSTGKYQDSAEDDFTDHFLDAGAEWQFNARNQLELSGSLADTHEKRGTGYSQGYGELLDEPLRYKEADINGLYTHGTDTAKGNLELQLGKRSRNYDESELDFADRDTTYAVGRLLTRVGSRSSFVLEARQREIAYDAPMIIGSSLDSSETDLLAGMEWRGSAMVTGSAKVGVRRKKFDEAGRDDYSTPAWEVGLRWNPLSYTVFEFGTERRFEEPRGTGDFAVVEEHSIAWGHSWADRFSTEVAYFAADTDYEGIDRDETRTGATLGFNYEMRRWLTVEAELTTFDRESNIDGLEADRTLTTLGFRASL
ncbi:outer membrane beta-barrel protein [Microbulbifer yueqingensis]|uniref:Putative beta-barrel porin 2 n=1 Tax=Microbulbifer yueqingensis TaxID=658219 RepID=A0A1G8VKH2_9GAMM|nr:outer membrane beta-barrel protein [Microbulbifer yueqingensis]SDJ66588.1 Putative beta-barrel porin 2 [Microbulbifer yueqingensis]